MTNEANLPLLLPCPHCGNLPRWDVTVSSGNRYLSIVCEDSACYANLVSSACPECGVDELAAKWNRRSLIDGAD